MKEALIYAISKSSVDIPKPELNNDQFSNIISTVLAVAGAVAVIFVVLGGLRYTISQGNAQDVQKGKDMIVYALVGLAFVILAFTIVQFLTNEIF